jgi:hypothetical protein
MNNLKDDYIRVWTSDQECQDYCFWCHTLLGEEFITLDRTVIDNSGAHIEHTPFCLSCWKEAQNDLKEAAPGLKTRY